MCMRHLVERFLGCCELAGDVFQDDVEQFRLHRRQRAAYGVQRMRTTLAIERVAGVAGGDGGQQRVERGVERRAIGGK